MKAYWDSSAIVQATADLALRARLHADGGYTRPHAITETFSALTAGGLTVRVEADQAARLLENLAADLSFVELTPQEMLAALKEARKRGVRGGRIHDFMHAVAAKKSGADRILTLDQNDFAGLADSLPIEQA